MKQPTVVAILLSLFLLSACSQSSTPEIQSNSDSTFSSFLNNTYSKLDTILQHRKNKLIDYLNTTTSLVSKVKTDEALINFFSVKNEYYQLKKQETIPPEIVHRINKLKESINNYYLVNYINFYDLLFINTEGDIFYTIRKQADYHKNIFEGELKETKLSRKIANSENESFVDFEFYSISGEPSAFFIEPIVKDGKKAGWIVLQFSINKINNLFAEHEQLGTTGEVFLVNQDHYMLTDSRFKANHTILKQKLAYQNIESKFNEKKGHKSVVDYRGEVVYSAFETFNFLNSKWLIISKIDKNEVVTQYYKSNKKTLIPKILTKLEAPVVSIGCDSFPVEQSSLVHMDEFHRTTSQTHTIGIATCTGISICYPQKFTYLAHISPYDKIYNEEKTDLVNRVIKHLNYFDITPSEKRNLQINIVSTQYKSIENIFDIIIEKGYFLNQIKTSISTKAQYGDMFCNTMDASCLAHWKHTDFETCIAFDSLPNIEEIISTVIETENK